VFSCTERLILFSNMTHSIKDLLLSKDFDEPAEVQKIKQFIRKKYDSDCKVTISKFQTIVSVKSASLAGTLRMNQSSLRQFIEDNRKLIIRIG
jgi:hypothetical protein